MLSLGDMHRTKIKLVVGVGFYIRLWLSKNKIDVKCLISNELHFVYYKFQNICQHTMEYMNPVLNQIKILFKTPRKTT
jgi:hypothetical protein